MYRLGNGTANAGYFSSDWDMTINASILILKDSINLRSRRGKMWLFVRLLGIPVSVENLQYV